MIQKYLGSLWRTGLHPRTPVWSPGTAISRRGATILAHFNTINTVSFDHPDPSIFTVLTSPSDVPGRAVLIKQINAA